MTKAVIVEGWHDLGDPKPISLVDAMRQHAGLSLPDAKKLLDRLADDGCVSVPCATMQVATAFLQAAVDLGARARIVETEPRS